MTREQKIKELTRAVGHGHMTVGDVLNEAWDCGFKEASDKAWGFVTSRILESERNEQFAFDYIRTMIKET